MVPKNRREYLENELFPTAMKNGNFGRELTFVGCELDAEAAGVDQYASSVVFLTATATSDSDRANKIQTADHQHTRFNLVVKFQPTDAKVRELMNSDVQFHNELSMYTTILPKLDNSTSIISSIFPKFYFGVSTLGNDPESDVVAIEDLRGLGFRLTEERAFLDYDHVALTLTALGKFHALSYVLKSQAPAEFAKLTAILKEHHSTNDMNIMIQKCSFRGIDPVLEESPKDPLIIKLRKLFEDKPQLIMKELITPEEPMSVICHGDFLRNNLLFSYDPTGKPKSVRFFDLQRSRYASPVIDLSLFLWINTTYELRSKHWNEFIKIYHESLSKVVEENDCSPPTLEQIHQELSKKGIYGYIHCSYFLPIMVCDFQLDIEQSASMSPDEMAIFMSQVSGEYGTKLLADIVRHISQFKCFS
ncbi:hypothetical protein LSTR_LSTR015325 [Laodelphax striatellus]|uniref:CHK kinase-like domain-containing protein n=1 Tax=Laodelphax striatellus TaxID=195883 RepID=A0A482WU47_LAOST|nr:hypothetical protein LSTR_LSTR015325 [Laodelphax striatellus]